MVSRCGSWYSGATRARRDYAHLVITNKKNILRKFIYYSCVLRSFYISISLYSHKNSLCDLGTVGPGWKELYHFGCSILSTYSP